jgi:hypothetical protein
VLFGVTVVRKDGVRNEFWGQALLEGKELLDKKTKIRVNLGDFRVGGIRTRCCIQSTSYDLVLHIRIGRVAWMTWCQDIDEMCTGVCTESEMCDALVGTAVEPAH